MLLQKKIMFISTRKLDFFLVVLLGTALIEGGTHLRKAVGTHTKYSPLQDNLCTESWPPASWTFSSKRLTLVSSIFWAKIASWSPSYIFFKCSLLLLLYLIFYSLQWPGMSNFSFFVLFWKKFNLYKKPYSK